MLDGPNTADIDAFRRLVAEEAAERLAAAGADVSDDVLRELAGGRILSAAAAKGLWAWVRTLCVRRPKPAASAAEPVSPTRSKPRRQSSGRIAAVSG